MHPDFSIGDLADATGCKVQTIRYYEQIGLMPEPPRTEGRQRRYAKEHRQRLDFIRHARELGFGVETIRELLDLADQPERACGEVDQIATLHLKDIDSKIARLTDLRGEVQRMIRSCKRGRIAECRVIEVLADHSRPFRN